MLVFVLIYNTLLLIVLVGSVGWLVRHPTVRNGAGVMALGAAAAVWAAVGLGQTMFFAAHLAGYGLFVFAPLLLLGVAWAIRRTHRPWAIGSALLATAIAAVGVDAFLIEPQWLEVTHHEIRSKRVAKPVRIVVLADLQTDRIGPYKERVLAEVARAKPDVLLLAGDYIQTYDAEHFTRQAEKLNRLFGRFFDEAASGERPRAFAVRGNVDDFGLQAVFRDTPVEVANRRRTFPVAGLVLTCLGLEESFDTTTRVARPGEADDRFHIVMGHSPNFALGRVEADLMVAGHTHGGQVRLPLLGPVLTLSAVPRDWAAGLTQIDDGRRLLVSRGVGMERGRAPRLRFLCRPELVVVDLLPEDSSDAAGGQAGSR